MARPTLSLSSLRSALPLTPSCPSSQASSSRTFTTSSSLSTAVYTRKRAVWKKVRLHREAIKPVKETQGGVPDYILGSIKSHPNLTTAKNPVQRTLNDRWPKCKLAKLIIHPQTVWNLPPPNYENGEQPQLLLPGLSESDKDMIFGALPHVSTELKYDHSLQPDLVEAIVTEEMEKQEKQSEMVMRILDLRNASRSEINKMNKRRIVEEFGNGQAGSSFVQVALLTMKIRGTNEHLMENHKDVQNRLAMRADIFARAKHLRYIKRKWPDKYDQLLLDCGLHPRAVEGELITRL